MGYLRVGARGEGGEPGGEEGGDVGPGGRPLAQVDQEQILPALLQQHHLPGHQSVENSHYKEKCHLVGLGERLEGRETFRPADCHEEEASSRLLQAVPGLGERGGQGRQDGGGGGQGGREREKGWWWAKLKSSSPAAATLAPAPPQPETPVAVHTGEEGVEAGAGVGEERDGRGEGAGETARLLEQTSRLQQDR